MSKIRLHGSSSGYTEIAPVAASGNNTLTLPNDGTIISKDSAGAIGVTSVRATNAHFSGTTRVTTGITTTSQVTGNLQFNSGFGSVATAYGCRAWIQLNQGGSQSITGSGNVSSITDEGTGTTKITFTTAMPDGNYAMVGGAQQSGDASVNYCFSLCMQSYTTAYSILIYRPSASSDVKEDNSKIHVAFFR